MKWPLGNAGKRKSCYVLSSGGQDSLACSLLALEYFDSVEAISVQYGQRHEVELEYAKSINKKLGIHHTIYDLGSLLRSFSDSSLLQETVLHNTPSFGNPNLPSSFLPNRNGLLLTVAASHAYKKEDNEIHLVIGACQTDYSGYPDCRDIYIQAKSSELSLGLERTVTIHAPLLFLKKSDVFEIAEEFNELDLMISGTMTCYDGCEDLNQWGRGCGTCPSCSLRKKGYDEYNCKKE